MRERRSAGGAGARVLIVLLLAAAAAGAWNYRRNVAAEEAEFRPYRSYGEPALEQLAVAYREEVEALGARLEAVRRHRARPSGSPGALLDERVADFERVQRDARQERELAGRRAEREAALRDVESELARREAERDRVRLFLRRLLTFE